MDGTRGRIAASVSAAAVIVLLLQSFASANHCTGCIDKTDIARNSVGAAEIIDGSVGKPEVRAGAVGTSEIRNGSVQVRDLDPTARSKVFYAYDAATQEVDGLLVDIALPRGNWLLFATALIGTESGAPANLETTCTLDAGSSADSMTFGAPADGTSEDPRQITLTIPVALGTADTATLSCTDGGDDDVIASAARLSALRVDAISSENEGA